MESTLKQELTKYIADNSIWEFFKKSVHGHDINTEGFYKVFDSEIIVMPNNASKMAILLVQIEEARDDGLIEVSDDDLDEARKGSALGSYIALKVTDKGKAELIDGIKEFYIDASNKFIEEIKKI